jgi:hypothetical protein
MYIFIPKKRYKKKPGSKFKMLTHHQIRLMKINRVQSLKC